MMRAYLVHALGTQIDQRINFSASLLLDFPNFSASLLLCFSASKIQKKIKHAHFTCIDSRILSGFIPALYFGFPKRALRNHADCLQPLENYLASPKAEIILLRSAKKILAQGKALEEWRCSRKTVRKYLFIPVQL